MILEIAKRYTSLGFSIIPVPSGQKKPIIKWEKYQNKRPLDQELQEWFEKGDSNIALLTGELSGIDVVDVDQYKKNSGVKVDSLLQVRTPGGGQHFYFKHSDGIRNTTNADIATDIRGEGGFVLLPPSLHPNGGRYEWVNGFPKKEDLELLKEMPKELLEKIRARKIGETFDYSSAFELEIGTRNDIAHRMACSLLNKHDPKTAWKLLKAVNAGYKPPLAVKDLQTLFNSALDYVKANPPQKPQELLNLRENEIWKPTSFAEDLEQVKQNIREGKNRGIPSGFPSLDELAGGLFPGQSYLFYADTNVGKSAFASNIFLYLANHGMRSTYFDLENDMDLANDRLIPINEGGVLTVSVWRLMKEAKQHDEPMDRLAKLPIAYWDLLKLQNRFEEITFEAVKTIIDEEITRGCKVFILDHLHYFEPSQRDYNRLASIARNLNDISSTKKIIFITIAHTRKGLLVEKDGEVIAKRPLQDDVFGGKLIVAHTKNVIGIMRNEKATDPIEQTKTLFFVDKTKFGPCGKFSLTFDPETLVFKDSQQYKTKPVFSELQEQISNQNSDDVAYDSEFQDVEEI